jgi:hypothetical protein
MWHVLRNVRKLPDRVCTASIFSLPLRSAVLTMPICLVQDTNDVYRLGNPRHASTGQEHRQDWIAQDGAPLFWQLAGHYGKKEMEGSLADEQPHQLGYWRRE